MTAFVVVAEGLPYLGLGLFAGAIADRVDRRRLMVRADRANAVVLGSAPVAYALGGLTAPHVLLAAFAAAVVAWLSPLRGIDAESPELKVRFQPNTPSRSVDLDLGRRDDPRSDADHSHDSSTEGRHA